MGSDTRPVAFEDDLARRVAEARPSMLFDGASPEDLAEWQERFSRVLCHLLGVIPDRVPPVLQYMVQDDCGSYVRHRVQYETEAGVHVPAYLLCPKTATEGDRAPGLLCIHGHGDFGKDSVVGLATTPEREDEIVRHRYDYGRRYAEQGYVVLAPDLRGFGERRRGYPDPRVDRCCPEFLAASFLGTTVMALNLCDLFGALDVLTSLPHVDAERIGCVGLSLGGRMIMMVSALDRRVRVAVPSGCMNLYQERYQTMHTCGAQVIPGLLQYGDTPEIFSLIAPRPMVIEIGSRDPLIPHDWAATGLRRIRRAYTAARVPENLLVARFDGAHQFDGALATRALAAWREGRA